MLNAWTQGILRQGKWRLIHIGLVVLNIMLAATIVLQYFTPMRANDPTIQTADGNSPSNVRLSDIVQPGRNDFETLAPILRPGLFRPSSSLRDNPIADKTIERIKSQLKLQCVMHMKQEFVAYIHVQGLGLKKCKVGDTVNDLFTVLNITTGQVEITIIGHKVVLSL